MRVPETKGYIQHVTSISALTARFTFAEIDRLFEEGVSARKFKRTGEEMRKAEAALQNQ